MGTVSMGELAIASAPGEELVARGLGSCIGLALVDRVAGVAGLAHIVLPEAQDKQGATAKFADRAVPALIAQMCNAGASERRLEAAIAGGAKMFEVSGDLDIGGRNEIAVRHELATAWPGGSRRRDRRQPRTHDARRGRRLRRDSEGIGRRDDHSIGRKRVQRL